LKTGRLGVTIYVLDVSRGHIDAEQFAYDLIRIIVQHKCVS